MQDELTNAMRKFHKGEVAGKLLKYIG